MGAEFVVVILFWLSSGLIVYHLVLYPLLLAALNRVFAKPIQRGEYFPTISIIVPAHNEAGVIGDKVRSILGSDYPADRMEIIVAEDGSSDDTADQVFALGDARVILDHSPERSGKMAALNRAARRASGEVLVFTDANAMLWPGTLRSLLSNFADLKVGLASGRKLLYGESRTGNQREHLLALRGPDQNFRERHRFNPSSGRRVDWHSQGHLPSSQWQHHQR